jgi:hypothetical protein
MRSALVTFTLSLAGTVTLAAEPQPPIVKNSELRRELLSRIEEDQAARFAMVDWMKAHGGSGAFSATDLTSDEQAEVKQLTSRVQKVDAKNTKWLKTVLDEHGWPTMSLVGKDGANAAWLLVQHADRDTKFQRQCLDLMTKLPQGEAAPQNLAYLTDRVLLAEGKKQLYGTQFITKDGKLQPKPIKDEPNVDARRATVGLPPMAEYVKVLDEQYDPAKK